MRLVIASDTHGWHRSLRVPDGDIFIHCGDFTTESGRATLKDFLTWLAALPHKHKIFIAGNHDFAFEKRPDFARGMVRDFAPGCTYLEDSGVVLEGVQFWGTPVQPEFFNWAFNRKRGPEIRRHWDMIPDSTRILITHGPPFGHLDLSDFGNEKAGCRDLYETILRVQPEVHCFGHIHGSYGTEKLVHDGGFYTWFFNASICNEGYRPTRSPLVYEISSSS